MPMMSFLAKEPEKKQRAKKDVARFDIKRMPKALASEQFEVPRGLTREEKREFILSKA